MTHRLLFGTGLWVHKAGAAAGPPQVPAATIQNSGNHTAERMLSLLLLVSMTHRLLFGTGLWVHSWSGCRAATSTIQLSIKNVNHMTNGLVYQALQALLAPLSLW